MENSKAIRLLKARLLALAADQLLAKRARKRLPDTELSALRRALSGSNNPEWSPQRDVLMRRVTITACLNLYHDLRGSAHRHGIEKGWEWRHDGELARLRREAEAAG